MVRATLILIMLIAGGLYSQPPAVRQADSLIGRGEWERAGSILESALARYQESDTLRAWVLHRLGGVQYYLYNYPQAESALNEAWAIRKASLDSRDALLANTAYMQALLALARNRLGHAEEKLRVACEIWENEPVRFASDLADGYRELANLYSQAGDFGRAEVFLNKALAHTTTQAGLGPRVAELYLLKGVFEDQQGKSLHALQSLRTAARLYTASSFPEDKLSLANCWQNTGLALGHVQRFDSAATMLRRAENVYRRLVPDYPEARKALFDNWDNQGIILKNLGLLDSARVLHRRALDSLETLYEAYHPDLAPSYDNLGDLALHSNDPRTAFSRYSEGLRCLSLGDQSWANPRLAVRLLYGQARAAEAVGDKEGGVWHDLALHGILTADTLLRHMRETFLEDSARQALTENYLPMYETGLSLARKLEDDRAAFTCIVAGRAALLRRSINSLQAARALGIPDSLVRRLRFTQAELALAEGETRDRLLARLRELSQEVNSRYPALASIRNARLPSLETFQAALSPNEAALLCFWGEREVYLLWLGEKEVEWYGGETGGMRQVVDVILRGQSDPGASLDELRKAGNDLYTYYLPIPALAGSYNRLLVLPDGPLAQMSWVALPWNDKGWLVEKLAVRTAPAIDLAFSRKAIHKRSNLIYAVAPRYAANDRWPDLPMARRVAFEAYEIFGGRVDTGGMAGRKQFMENAPQADILHIGAHGVLSDQHPLKGGVLLADSMLYISEVYGMELSARLAVLTACHSGGGIRQQGEGILSLARAFAHAGCQSLLTSRWEASADATAQISLGFYQAIQSGDAPQVALQEAQIAYMRQAPPERRHPYYWAGLHVSGGGGRYASGAKWWLWLSLIGAVGVLAGAWYSRRSRSSQKGHS